MKIENVNGTSTETDILPDVDALLLEESHKLQGLYKKYNRQLFLVGDTKNHNGGITMFFHIGQNGIKESPDEFSKAIHSFWYMVDGTIQSFSQGDLCIKNKVPPSED